MYHEYIYIYIQNGDTCAHVAARSGREDFVKLVCDFGAPLKLKNKVIYLYIYYMYIYLLYIPT